MLLPLVIVSGITLSGGVADHCVPDLTVTYSDRYSAEADVDTVLESVPAPSVLDASVR